jgi:hypothetical protein
MPARTRSLSAVTQCHWAERLAHILLPSEVSAPVPQRLRDGPVMACCATCHRHHLTATAMAQDAFHSIITTPHIFRQRAPITSLAPSPDVSCLA